MERGPCVQGKPLWDLRIQRVQRVVEGAINYCRRPFIKKLSNGPQARLARFFINCQGGF